MLSVEASVKSRTSYGGTAPKNVTAQAKAWAEAAGKRAKIGLRQKFRCNFMASVARRLSPEQGNLCMVRPRIGDFVVTSNYRLSSSGWAIILLSVTALALAGCGRKGGLDLPPNAPNASSQAAVADSEAERAAQPGVFNPGLRVRMPRPTAAKGNKKPFILDPLAGTERAP